MIPTHAVTCHPLASYLSRLVPIFQGLLAMLDNQGNAVYFCSSLMASTKHVTGSVWSNRSVVPPSSGVIFSLAATLYSIMLARRFPCCSIGLRYFGEGSIAH